MQAREEELHSQSETMKLTSQIAKTLKKSNITIEQGFSDYLLGKNPDELSNISSVLSHLTAFEMSKEYITTSLSKMDYLIQQKEFEFIHAGVPDRLRANKKNNLIALIQKAPINETPANLDVPSSVTHLIETVRVRAQSLNDLPSANETLTDIANRARSLTTDSPPREVMRAIVAVNEALVSSSNESDARGSDALNGQAPQNGDVVPVERVEMIPTTEEYNEERTCFSGILDILRDLLNALTSLYQYLQTQCSNMRIMMFGRPAQENLSSSASLVGDEELNQNLSL